MTTALKIIKQADGTIFITREGKKQSLSLLPPLSGKDCGKLEISLPCPIPTEERELFQYARGFEVPNLLKATHGALTEFDLSGVDGGFGLEEVFPHAFSVAGDGCGNFWVVDLTRESKSWEPIFFACHDPPVIVYQTDSLAHFIEDALKGGNPPWHSEIEDVHGTLTTRIWRENPGVLSFEECVDSTDADLRAFAQSLDASYEFVDLRAPKLGDGFSWGRYGNRFGVKRFGEKRIFANQKKSRWQKFKDAWK
jgi:hypothetical protein